MSRKTLINLTIVVVLVGVVWGVSLLQRGARVGSLMRDLQQADDYQAYKAMRKISGLGGSASARAASLLSSPQPYVRARAALLVGDSGDRRHVAAVEALLRDPEASVRQAAATALGHLGAPEAAQPLLTLLQDAQQPLEVRTAAARSLGLIAAPEAAPALIALLQSPSNPAEVPLREAATVALGAIKSGPAVDALVARLDPAREPETVLRTLAAEALAHVTGPDKNQTERVTVALLQALDPQREKAAEVRIAAAHALGQLSLPSEQREAVRAALQEALNDPQYWVREAARKAQG